MPLTRTAKSMEHAIVIKTQIQEVLHKLFCLAQDMNTNLYYLKWVNTTLFEMSCPSFPSNNVTTTCENLKWFIAKWDQVHKSRQKTNHGARGTALY